MERRLNQQNLGGCQAGLLKPDKGRFKRGGVVATLLVSASLISIPDSGITKPWQELHIKKGEQGASG
jgi:hypothetical protein